MKTKGLDGYTAVRMLLEGKCETIESEKGSGIWNSPGDTISLYRLSDETFRLIGYKPPTEEVKGWINIYEDGLLFSSVYPSRDIANQNCMPGRVDCVQITYHRPIPEPEEEVWRGVVQPRGFDEDNQTPTHGHLSIFLPLHTVGKTVEVRVVPEEGGEG